MRGVCDRFDVPPLAAAIQFPFRDSAVATVVVGARTAHEISESAGYLAHEIPADFWSALPDSWTSDR